MLDTAFEALKKFDYGSVLAELAPIEDAVIAAHGNAEAGKEIEQRLVAALQGELSRDAQEWICRNLATIGTAAAVPRLAVLVIDKDLSRKAWAASGAGIRSNANRAMCDRSLSTTKTARRGTAAAVPIVASLRQIHS